MVRFKNITVKKRGGGSRKQRVQVLKSGKFKFVKNLRRSKSNPKKGKTKKRRSRRMAKRKRRRSSSMTIPLAPILGLVGGFVIPATWQGQSPLSLIMAGRFPDAIEGLMSNYTGLNPRTGQFRIEDLMHGVGSLVLGGMVHKFVGGKPLNINAMLGRAGVPIIRI